MKRIFQILGLTCITLFYSGCKKEDVTLNDLELKLANNFMKTFVTVVFEDAATGEMMEPAGLDKIEVSFAGADQSLTMTPGGKRKNQFSTATGTVEFNLDPYAKVPSMEQPVQLVLQASYPGYLPVTRQISIPSEGIHRLYVSMIKKDNLPSGVTSVKVDDFSSATGGKINATVEQAVGTSGAKIKLTEGTELKTVAGTPLNGQLSLEARLYDPRVANTSDLFPGGVTGQYRDADGNIQNTFLAPGAWMDIEIRDNQGNIASQVASGTIGLSLPVNPGLYNPLTHQTIKEGDHLQLMSFDPSSGMWQNEGDAVYTTSAVQVGLKHLSTWGLSVSTKGKIVQINIKSLEYELLKSTYDFNFTEADFDFTISTLDAPGSELLTINGNEGNNELSTALPDGDYSVAVTFKNPRVQSVFKLPDPLSFTVSGSTTINVVFFLTMVDSFTVLNGSLSYLLNNNNTWVVGGGVLFRFRESGTSDWRKVTTSNNCWMSIQMKAGNYESQVSRDGKWEPETPQVVTVNQTDHLYTISRASSPVDPLKTSGSAGSGTVTLTIDQMKQQAQAMQVESNGMLARLRILLAEVRAKHDVIKTLFLSDRLTEISTACKSIDGHVQSLLAMAIMGDMDKVKYHFTVVGVLRDRITSLMNEAFQFYDNENVLGKSNVNYSVDLGPDHPDPNLNILNSSPRTLNPILIITSDGKAKIAFEDVPPAPAGWIMQ